MIKVYIVTEGEYSDYGIIGVFSTKDKAEKFVEEFGGDIEEYGLDILCLMKNKKIYSVKMTKEGVATVILEDYCCIEDCINKRYGFDNKNMYFYCFAKDKPHAIKIANEWRTNLIANNQWGETNLKR